ncbi:MAG: flagellar hook-length control protein FliK [Bacillota bacterium]
MEKVVINSLTNSLAYKDNLEDSLKPGNIIQARVIENLPDGLLLLIGNTKVKAETNMAIPKGDIISLLVAINKDGKLVLTANNKIFPVNIFAKSHPPENEEILKIITKLEKSKINLNFDEVVSLKNFLKHLPLNLKDGLNLLLNPDLYAALIHKLNNKDYFSVSVEAKKNKKAKHQQLMIHITLDSEELGRVSVNLSQSDLLKIIFSCNRKETTDLINGKIDLLAENLNFIPNKEIVVKFNPSLPLGSNTGEKNPETGINILI